MDTSMAKGEWHTHPRFPSQTLPLDSHESFRHVSDVLVAEAAAGGFVRPVADLYGRWMAAMHSHEAYGEGKLYPDLERRFATSLEAAKAGHRALRTAHDEVVKALAKEQTGDEPRATEALHQALPGHDDVLNTRLNVEEELVIPMLLALSPHEFVEYCDTSIDRLMQRLDERAIAALRSKAHEHTREEMGDGSTG